MRRIQSLFKTLLMLIPMTAVPVMAIFGIPQFFPVSASPSARTSDSARTGQMLERRVGQSDALVLRSVLTEQSPSIDLFHPYDRASTAQGTNSAGVVANASSSELERRRRAWRDPLTGPANTRSEVSLRTTTAGGTTRRERSLATASVSRRGDGPVQRKATASFSGQAMVPPRALDSRLGVVPVADTDSDIERPSAAVELSNRDISDRYSRESTGGRANSSNLDLGRVETLTWQQAVDRLTQLGIRTFRLTPDSGQTGYRFVCFVTSVDDPRISRRFEAESSDPLIAVGDVLAQVENWNQHR